MVLDERERRLMKAYKALGDPTRLRLLRLLAGGELGCGDLSRSLKVSPSTLSYHTSRLEDCGLIDVRKEGQFHFFSLRRAEVRRLAPALLEGGGSLKNA